jgi:ABC-type sugar transport system ATPase subunit
MVNSSYWWALPVANIEDGEFIVLVGPSGCGKSTTLRLIAGLEVISSGEMIIGDRLVNDIHPRDRDIAMVFQNYALYPQMTVYDNMSFSLKMRKVPIFFVSTSCSTASRDSCPAVSVSGWPLVEPLSGIHKCFFSMNPCPTWTPSSELPCGLSL